MSIEKRLVFKQRQKQAFETHLQAFLLQNIWRDDLSALLEIDPARPLWLGNEVSCGVGMQRMDVVTRQETAERVLVQVLELKDEPPGATASSPASFRGTSTGSKATGAVDGGAAALHPAGRRRTGCRRGAAYGVPVGRPAGCGMRGTDALCVEPVRFIAFSIGDAVAFERVF